MALSRARISGTVKFRSRDLKILQDTESNKSVFVEDLNFMTSLPYVLGCRGSCVFVVFICFIVKHAFSKIFSISDIIIG